MKTVLRYFLCAIIPVAFCACGHNPVKPSGEIRRFAARNAEDLKRSGPSAWLKYFDPNNFQMTVNGQTVYGSFPEAAKGVHILSSQFSKVDLVWASVTIKEMGPDYGEYNARYTEDLISKPDSADHFYGTFSGLAHRTATGWKWRSIRWTVQAK